MPGPRPVSRAAWRRIGLTALLVVAASTAVQGSAVVSHGLFDDLGAAGVSGLRFLLAAAVAVALVRPSWRGRTATAWGWICLYGSAIAAMNLAMYQALRHLPLGVAVTIELLGPLTLAATRLPHRRYVVLPVICLLGLVLVTKPGGELPVAGLVLAGIAAVALATYAVVAERIGALTTGAGWDELALALVVAAAWTLPFAVPALPHVEPAQWPPLAGAAGFGVLVAFALDFLAVRMSSARVVAVLLTFDPVLGALLGAVFLAEVLDPITLLGIALVVVAGAAATTVHAPAPEPATAP